MHEAHKHCAKFDGWSQASRRADHPCPVGHCNQSPAARPSALPGFPPPVQATLSQAPSFLTPPLPDTLLSEGPWFQPPSESSSASFSGPHPVSGLKYYLHAEAQVSIFRPMLSTNSGPLYATALWTRCLGGLLDIANQWFRVSLTVPPSPSSVNERSTFVGKPTSNLGIILDSPVSTQMHGCCWLRL